MNSFEIYEPGDMNDSKEEYENDNFQSKNPEYAKELINKINERTLQKYFLRMSCERKIDFITKLFFETRSLQSLSSILNIFFSVNTKLIFYSKITNESNSLYEQFVHDHDRILDAGVLNEKLLEDIKWFGTLNNSEQINLITSLMRLSGGNVIKKMYWRLIKIFNERMLSPRPGLKRYTSRTSMIFPDDTDRPTIKLEEYLPKYSGENESDYNPDLPAHKKVLEGRKQWQAIMGKIRKEIDAEVQKLNEQIIQKMAAKKEGSIKKSSKKSNGQSSQKSTSPRPHHTEIDWIQLLPVWTVKKIFSYLDKKVLQNLKNVNSYWSTISKEVIAEKKMRGHLDWSIKKSEEFLGHLLETPLTEADLLIEQSLVVLENTSFKKRMEKQLKTGTSIRKLKQDPSTLHNKALLTDCFSLLETEFKPILTQLRPFPVGVPIVEEVEKLSVTPLGSIYGTNAKTKPDTTSIATSSLHSKASPAVVEHIPERNLFDDIDSVTIHSMIPSIVVTEENLDTW